MVVVVRSDFLMHYYNYSDGLCLLSGVAVVPDLPWKFKTAVDWELISAAKKLKVFLVIADFK